MRELVAAGASCGPRCFCACHQEPEPIALEDFGLRAEWFPRAWQQRSVLEALVPPGSTVSPERLLVAIYGRKVPRASDLRALRVTVHRLRQTLAAHGWALRSVARHGYMLERVAG